MKEHNELTLHEILDVISDFAGLGGRILELSGGEPIAFPDLREVMRHGNSLGLEIRVYTSGVERFSGGIARAPPKAFWEYLQSDGLAKIFLNLQGPDSVAHESITRIPGSFSAALESLRHAKDAGLFVGIHFVPMKPNFEQLADTARLTARLGADEFAVLRFVAQGRGFDNKDSLMLDSDEFSRLLRTAIAVRDCITGIKIRLGCPFNHRATLGDSGDLVECKAGVQVCHIRPTGEVVPCSAFQSGNLVLGNLHEASLRDLWTRSIAWTRFREAQRKGPTPGMLPFISEFGDPCLAQISNGDGRVVGESRATAKV